MFLFDEPLSNLDAALRVQTRLEIAKLHRDIGTASMIYVTHDQVEAMTLADRIVLLRSRPRDRCRRGSVAQVGTPMDLYHRPRNLFVAEFIGSPKMNLLPGKLLRAEAEHAVVDVHGEAVRVAVDARAASAGDRVTLGIRPEHLGVERRRQRRARRCAGTLQQIERLGDSSLLYLRVGSAAPLVTLKLEGTAAQAPGAHDHAAAAPRSTAICSTPTARRSSARSRCRAECAAARAQPTFSKRARGTPSTTTVSKNIACGRTHQPLVLYSGR